MKKIKIMVALLMVAVMAMAFCACGGSGGSADDADQVSIHDCTPEEMLEVTGVSLDAPKGAEDIVYSYVDSFYEGEAPIAQVAFTYDYNDYTYRAQKNGETSLIVQPPKNPTQEDFEYAQDDTFNKIARVSDINTTFDTFATAEFQGMEAVITFDDGFSGLISWLDADHGILYCLMADREASQGMLQEMAYKCYVPVE